ncbi:MAG: hypothetical protein IPM64_11505 [Phycisphaerales bacterium]|nr:hypothetical protein [Phycisphaerales bacterium]
MPPMPAQFGLHYPLWNHSREAGGLLDRACGEIGIDHLTIPVVTGPLQQFRPGWFGDAPSFVTEGGLHFRPDSRRYAVAGARPRMARWLGQRAILEEVCEEAQRRGLGIWLWVELRRVPTLFEPERHFAQRSAWGDPAQPPSACISNAGFRELLHAVIADLETRAPRGFALPDLALDDLQPVPVCDAAACHESAAVDKAGEGSGAASLCYCPACRAVAAEHGVDAEAAARAVRVVLCDAGDWRVARVGDPVVERYASVRLAAGAAALHRLAEPLGAGRCMVATERLQRSPMAQPAGFPLRGALDGQALPPGGSSAYVGHSRFCCRSPADDRAAQAFVRDVSEASARGGIIDFFNLEEAHPRLMDVLRQAVRYARRGG